MSELDGFMGITYTSQHAVILSKITTDEIVNVVHQLPGVTKARFKINSAFRTASVLNI